MPSSSSSSAQQARQALADQLREIRIEAGLSGRALAAEAGWHGVSKVSKIEHGVRPASAEDVRVWCRVCGISAERCAELLAEQRAVAGMWVTYQRLNRAGLRKAQESVRPLFERAQLVRSYQCRIIPGLLQTAGYTAAVLETVQVRQGSGVDDVAAALVERMARQRVLRQAGHRFVFVVEEAVLCYRICDAGDLRRQLVHLQDVMRLPSVSVGIIPQSVDRHRVLAREAFTLFDSELAHVELVSGVLSLTQQRDVAMYARDFTDLAGIAVHGEQARRLITDALDELD